MKKCQEPRQLNIKQIKSHLQYHINTALQTRRQKLKKNPITRKKITQDPNNKEIRKKPK